MQAVNFGVLLAILSYVLYRPILRMIDARQKRIAEGAPRRKLPRRRLEEAKTEGEGIVGSATLEAEGLRGDRARPRQCAGG